MITILSTCNLNQWALDFVGNAHRIRESILESKRRGARYRLGPELEVCGYSCEDHYLEQDTFEQSWLVIASLLRDSKLTENILCDIGMPVLHKSVRYNCRVFLLNGRVLFMRPKMFLANDGNYRELRYFHAWRKRGVVEDFYLPECVRQVCGQRTVPFGDGVLDLLDTCLGAESCEELFTPASPNIVQYLDGVEIIGNGSASHHQLRKLNTRVDLIRGATRKAGGVYLYANQQGCDGTRLYFDGSAMIWQNGELLAQGSQFSLRDVEVVSAAVDLSSVRAYRGQQHSRGIQASESKSLPRISVPFALCAPADSASIAPPTLPRAVRYHSFEQEIALGPACWLWDYLRRSGLRGFFLPLSGGADSASTAAIVGSMCQLVVARAKQAHAETIEGARRVTADRHYVPDDAREFASRIFFTCYMGTRNSSQETRDRAAALAKEIGATHSAVNIDPICDAFLDVFVQSSKSQPQAAPESQAASSLSSSTPSSGRRPQFKTAGGSSIENLALQNIQARSRMVFAYVQAQLLLWAHRQLGVGGGGGGSLLVLGSSNVDEALRGYFTKYDCSAADLNPIGAISKSDLRRFLQWAAEPDTLGYPTLARIELAPPTAELEPITSTYSQTDEQDMGMSYGELERFGALRKLQLAGPVAMFRALVHEWHHLPPRAVADKVKHFFVKYAINRHKMTTLTPSYHAEAYSPDDNRHDLRPFLYPPFAMQFDIIDRLVAQFESNGHRSKL
jgi:NAD+ synthase (glutamine-hydrolysing)